MKLIDFIDTKPKELYENLIADFQKSLGEPLLQGDERRIFLESFIPIILGLKNDINFTGNQNLLKYASGKYLDAIGDMFNVYRFPANESQTKVKFSLASPLNFDVIIPKSTRVTGDGKTFFITNENEKIIAGEDHVLVNVFATIRGKMPNGLTIGQINALVDLVPYIVSVSNIEQTFGGTDIEDDDNYRERIRISPERFSTAGPSGSYEFYALSASPLVCDVYIISPTPGDVDVYIVSSATVVPDDNLIALVEKALSADTVRPLTDFVHVKPAIVKTYDVEVIYFNSEDSKISDTILSQTVENEIKIFTQRYKEKMGGAINPDELKFEILKAGAYRVDVLSPEYTPLLGNEVAVAQTVTARKG